MQVEFVSSLDLHSRRWETPGVLVLMPFTDEDQARRSAELMARRAETDGLLLAIHDQGLSSGTATGAGETSERCGFVAIVNAAFRASSSPWVSFVAQDAFAGRQWLAIALAGLQRNKGVLAAFNDGKWHGQLASFGLARRAWIEELYDGDFFFPGYERHYADVELTVLALAAKAYVYSPESVLVEVDWDKDDKAVSNADRSMFRQRVKTGFHGRVADTALLSRFR